MRVLILTLVLLLNLLADNKNRLEESLKNSQIFIEPKPKFEESFKYMLSYYGDKETKSTIKQILARNFGLYPYYPNYFIPIMYDRTSKNDRKRFETKFQISFMKPLLSNMLHLNETLFLGYTQKSFWQIFQKSAPFRETNYEPEIFVLFPLKKNILSINAFRVSINHQSNGQKGEFSRSWNRIYAETIFQIKEAIFYFKVWYRIPENEKNDDNPDIEKYLGYGELRCSYPFKKHLINLIFRNNLRSSQNKGSIEIDWSFPIKSFKNTFGYIQFFNGYGESLIDYNKNVNKIGIGFSYSR